MLLCHTAVDLAFITDEDAKMQHIFAYNGLLWGGGLPPVTYISIKPSSSSCNTVTYRLRYSQSNGQNF